MPLAADMEPPFTIVCFSGVDWRSHRQRPHMLMESFARRGADVVFVDNLGTRLPRVRDAGRVARRLAGWTTPSRIERPARVSRPADGRRTGQIRVESPVVLPMQQLGPVRALGRSTLVRRLRRRVRPGSGPLVVWTYLPLPVIADAAAALGADLLVYDWSDDASQRVLSSSVRQRRRLGQWEDEMVRRADLVFVASAELLRSRGSANPNTHVVPHGSPGEHRQGRDVVMPSPSELAGLARPRIGFVGSISAWIDLPLIEGLARARPKWSFVMVGPVKTSVRTLRRLPNVTLIGERPHEEIPAFLAGFDVAIIPYRVTPAMAAASPVKLREYLEAGLPVISVDVPEVHSFAPRVQVASGIEGFLREIEGALARRRPRRRIPKGESWDERASEMIARMDQALLAAR